MKKSVLCILLSILLLPIYGTAEATDPTPFDLKSLAEDTVFLARADDPANAILGLERNADVKRYPASTTKILTCIVALEHSSPDEIVTVGKRACRLSERNSKMGLSVGESYPMIDLLYGLMLPSGNDAAIAIAEHVGGSVEGFAKLMNQTAERIGMTGSHFMNPHGLHNSDHYTTARDMSILTAYAMQNETFMQIVSSAEYTAHSVDGRTLELKSSNRLLRDVVIETYTPYSCLYPDAIGIKTGDTHLAGKCLVAAARRNGTTYILVLLHGENAPSNAKGREKDLYSAQRFFDAIDLFEYAFQNDVVTVSVSDLAKRCLPDSYAVTFEPGKYLAKAALYRIEWDTSAELLLPRWQADAFLLDPFPDEYLEYVIESETAPIGSKAGIVSIRFRNEVVFSGSLIVDEYDLPPTAEPTSIPTYRIEIATPETTHSVEPDTTSSPASTAQPAESSWSFWDLFRCSPDR
jgi:D-alanyl-D-alanine carboxypeptidase